MRFWITLAFGLLPATSAFAEDTSQPRNQYERMERQKRIEGEQNRRAFNESSRWGQPPRLPSPEWRDVPTCAPIGEHEARCRALRELAGDWQIPSWGERLLRVLEAGPARLSACFIRSHTVQDRVKAWVVACGLSDAEERALLRQQPPGVPPRPAGIPPTRVVTPAPSRPSTPPPQRRLSLSEQEELKARRARADTVKRGVNPDALRAKCEAGDRAACVDFAPFALTGRDYVWSFLRRCELGEADACSTGHGLAMSRGETDVLLRFAQLRCDRGDFSVCAALGQWHLGREDGHIREWTKDWKGKRDPAQGRRIAAATCQASGKESCADLAQAIAAGAGGEALPAKEEARILKRPCADGVIPADLCTKLIPADKAPGRKRKAKVRASQ